VPAAPGTTIGFTRALRIAASPAAVFAELSDPRCYLGLQPLLVDVTELERGVDDVGHPFRRFASVERIVLFGVFPFRNRIESRLTLEEDGRALRVDTASRPGIRLRAAYTFASEEIGTLLRLSVAIGCPRLLARFVGREAERAHDALLTNLKTRLEPSR
jgi:hypothetical protein